MKLACSNCATKLPSAVINVKTDLAKCPQCGTISKVSTLTEYFDPYKIDLSPPKQSQLRIERKLSGEILIFYPAQGLSGVNWFVAGFATFWLTFICFWTIMATSFAEEIASGIIPLLFSIPFWLAGFAMVAGLVSSATSKQQITIGTDSIAIHKQSWLSNLNEVIDYSEIDAVIFAMPTFKRTRLSAESFSKVQAANTKIKWLKTVGLKTVADKKLFFFEQANESENQWLHQLLRAIIYQKKHQ